jgi:hypothetical protein
MLMGSHPVSSVNERPKPPIVLHVGLMKSGTSYIQKRLFHNQQLLAERGIVVPGKRWLDQVNAVHEVLVSGRAMGTSWPELTDHAKQAQQGAIISMEFLGPARRKAIRAFLRPLREHPVTVIITARDLNRTLPSLWQETIQNGRTWTWPEYLGDVELARPGGETPRRDRTSAGGTFWRQQDVARVAKVWSKLVGTENVRLVTLPATGASSEELWHRFEQATGLDFGDCQPIDAKNTSLGLASVLALRRLNELLNQLDMEFPKARETRKQLVAKRILAARRNNEPRLGCPIQPWLTAEVVAAQQAIRELGIEVVGSLDDLLPTQVSGVEVSEVSSDEVGEAATVALAGLISALHTDVEQR